MCSVIVVVSGNNHLYFMSVLNNDRVFINNTDCSHFSSH